MYLYTNNFPIVTTPDPASEYLVLTHIFNHNEFPLVGTTAFQGALAVNSPIYYYFLALFLIFHQGIETLYVLNILLQSVLSLTVYSITRSIYGKTAGIISLIFTGFTQLGMYSASFFYQPFLMQPFFFLCIYVLVRAYRTNRIQYIYGSVVFYVFATSLYLSSLAYLPIYLILVYRFCKNNHTVHGFRNTITLLFGGLLTTFFPVLVLLLRGTDQPGSVIVHTTLNYMDNMKTLLGMLDRSLLPHIYMFHSVSIGYLSWALILIFLAYHGIGRISKFAKLFTALCLICVILPILVISATNIPFTGHHIHLSGWFFIIVLSGILGTFAKNISTVLIAVITTSILLLSMSQGFSYTSSLTIRDSGLAANGVNREIASLHREYGISQDDIGFLRLQFAYVNNTPSVSFYPDYEFILMRETQTHQKIAYTNIYRGMPEAEYLKPYIIVTCLNAGYGQYERSKTDCLSTFFQKYPNYEMKKHIYGSEWYTIYMVKGRSANTVL